jgi:AraC-like DNA-binding protein
MDAFNANAVFTLTQALQLVGLVPCLFLIFFLATLASRNSQAVVPILYFIALACGFVLPLISLYPPVAENPLIKGALLFGESMLVGFSFLLILQFLMGRIPPMFYWLVLAIPLFGSGVLIFADMMQLEHNCLGKQACYDTASAKTLYSIFSSALIFLLLIYYSALSTGLNQDDVNRKHKYWLVIALILLNLFVLAIDLARLSEHITAGEADFARTMLRLTFIYLVITSLFRVFYPSLVSQVITFATAPAMQHDPEADKPHVDKIRQLLEGDRIYREMRLNRASLADKVGINEHALSRIINHYYGKNFNDLVNGYRIEEAKIRLKDEPTQQVTVIGFEVGFNSIASFNRVFKEKVGLSPSEWRSGMVAPPVTAP